MNSSFVIFQHLVAWIIAR